MNDDRIKLHIRSEGKRTTVVVDRILFDYLAIKLKSHPEAEDAKIVCQHWLQERLENIDFQSLSSTVRNLIISAIADPRLENKLQKRRLAS